MYIRLRKNKSGTTSVQIISKHAGSYQVIKHVGTAQAKSEIAQLKLSAAHYIQELHNTPSLFETISIKDRIRTLTSVQVGFLEIFGKIFDDIGFHEVLENPLFKQLVSFRIPYPVSKLKTVSIMNSEYGMLIDKMKVYRFMDTIDESIRKQLSAKGTAYVKTLTKQPIDVIFFDCTTLHFESFDEDDFRKNGYSKVGKFNQPQVLVALMVTKEGFPIGYEAFSGNTFEGHTLIPVLTQIRSEYQLDKVIFVADSGMLNEKNLQLLEMHKFEYVVGAKIKNESTYYKEQILHKNNYTDDIAEFNKTTHQRLIVSYSVKRATKDKADREKSIQRLKKKLVSKDKMSKSLVGNQGARKYIKLVGESQIYWNEEKILEDSRWDGLKGVLTNSKSMTSKEVLERYRHLWQVEKAFRMSKTDLKVRPIFHWKKSRIEAHLAITFASLLVGKVAEYKLQKKGYSLQRIVEMLRSVHVITHEDTLTGEKFSTRTSMTDEVKSIYETFRVSF